MTNPSRKAVLIAAALVAAWCGQQGCQQDKVEPAAPAEPEVGYRSLEDLAPPSEPGGPRAARQEYAATAPRPAAQYAAVPSPADKPAVPPVPPAPTHYTVQKGDTLWSLAASRLGSGRRWKEIQALNGGIDPTKLRVGQTLLIPAE